MNGRYELEPLPIPGGAMGQVWFGRDTTLDREVAVKFIRLQEGSSDDGLVRRFRRESRIMARLEHPGVPAVYDWGEEDESPFLVMQRVRGINVSDLIAEQAPLPIGWAAAIAAQVCSVLVAAHEAKLVHRDLKPGNLMLEPNGTVKVLDFGLAVAPTLADFSKITHSDQNPGTLAYMAPEQFLEANEANPASDLYALGCTLHEMLCGERPFDGSTTYLLMNQHLHEFPPPLRGLRAEVPVRLEQLVLDLLVKRPEDRPADASLVYRRLLPFVRELGQLPGALNPPSQRSPVRMYADVLSWMFADVSPAVRAPAPPRMPTPPSKGSATSGPDMGSSGSDLKRARDEADRMAGQSRYSHAAEVLASAIQSASEDAVVVDREDVESRLQLADLLFDSGDYQSAARTYSHIAGLLHVSEDVDRVLHCRKREASCHSRIGETNQALRKLENLLREVEAVLRSDDPRVTELLRDIALLRLSAGQRHSAGKMLKELPRER